MNKPIEKTIRAQLAEYDPELLLADGFDAAIIGVARRVGSDDVIVYDRAECITMLVAEGLSFEEANEHFKYNVAGAFIGTKIGAKTPWFLTCVDELTE